MLPNAFSCLKESLDESPDLVITGETHLQNGNYTDRVPGIFHLIVYKREMLDNVDFHSHPLSIDVETKKLAMDKANAVINIPLCIYVQRMYWDSGSRILARKIRSMELKNEQSA